MFNLGSAFGDVKIDVSSVLKAPQLTAPAFAKIGTQFESVGRNLSNVGRTMSLGFTAPIVAGVGGAVKVTADFNRQLSGVNAVLNATESEAAALRDTALQLSMRDDLKVNATQAAEAIELLAKNGLGVDEILDGAALAAVRLQNATGGDFAGAADIATDAMSLWNIEAKDMEKAVDGITSVTTSSKFAINDYRLALAQGGGVAAAVGVEFNDFNAAIAGMAPLFGSGSDAGTSFKVMLQRTVPQTNKAADAMRRIGLAGIDYTKVAKEQQDAIRGGGPAMERFTKAAKSGESTLEILRKTLGMSKSAFLDYQVQTGILQTSFHNLDGSMKSMPEIVGALNGSLDGLSDKQKQAALSTIFGTDAMRAAAGLGQLTREEFEKLQATMAQTSAAEQAAERINNLKGDMEVMQSVVQGLAIQFGSALIPSIREMTQTLTGAISKYGAMALKFGEMNPKISLAIGGFAGLVAAIGPVLVVVGTVASAIGTLLPAFGAVAAVLSGPVGLAIAGSVLAFTAWKMNLFGVRDAVVPIFDSIAGKVTTFASTVKTVLSGVGVGFSAGGLEGGVRAFADVLGIGQEKIDGFKIKVGEMVGALQSQFAPTFDRLKLGFDGMVSGFAPVGGALGELSGSIINLGGTIGTALLPILERIGSNITTMAGIVTGVGVFAFQSLLEVVAAIMPQIGPIVKSAIDSVTLIINSLSTVFAGTVGLIGGVISGDWSAVWNNAKLIVGTVVELVVGLLDGMRERSGLILDALGVAAGNIFGNLKSAVGLKVGEMRDGVLLKFDEIKRGVLEKVRGLFSEMGLDFDAFSVTWFGYFADMKLIASTVWNEIVLVVAENVAAMLKKVSDAVTPFTDTFKAIWKAGKDATVSGFKLIVTEVGKGIEKSITKALSYVSNFRQVGKDLLGGLKAGILSAAGSITTAVTDSVGGALSSAKNLLGIQSPSTVARDELGKPFVQGIIDGVEGMTPDLTKTILETIGSMNVYEDGSVDGLDDFLADLEVTEEQFMKVGQAVYDARERVAIFDHLGGLDGIKLSDGAFVNMDALRKELGTTEAQLISIANTVSETRSEMKKPFTLGISGDVRGLFDRLDFKKIRDTINSVSSNTRPALQQAAALVAPIAISQLSQAATQNVIDRVASPFGGNRETIVQKTLNVVLDATGLDQITADAIDNRVKDSLRSVLANASVEAQLSGAF